MFLDDSAVSAAGLLHSALILTSHALTEISKSKNPSVIAQHVTVELIEAQVSDVIAQMTKSEKVPGASNQAPVEMAIVPMHQSSESLYENLILNEEPKQPGVDLSCPPEMKETLISEDAANISLTLPSALKESLVSMLRRDKSHRETIITAQAAFRTSDLNHDGFLSGESTNSFHFLSQRSMTSSSHRLHAQRASDHRSENPQNIIQIIYLLTSSKAQPPRHIKRVLDHHPHLKKQCVCRR